MSNAAKDIVRSAWRHAEVGRKDQPAQKSSNNSGSASNRMGEVQFAIDHTGIDLMDTAACAGSYQGVTYVPATAIGNWDATVGSGQEWAFKKHGFPDRIEYGLTSLAPVSSNGYKQSCLNGESLNG